MGFTGWGWVVYECSFLWVAVWDLQVGVGLFMSVLSCGWQCGFYRLGLACLSVFFLVGGSVWGSRQYAYTIPNVFIVMNLLGSAGGLLQHLFLGGSLGFAGLGTWLHVFKTGFWVRSF